MLKIEKGIPLPLKKKSKGRPPQYPFADMQVSDSFAVRGKPAAEAQRAVSTAAAAWARRRNPSVKFATRQTDDGVRVWRIA